MPKKSLTPSFFGLAWTGTSTFKKLITEANLRYKFNFTPEKIQIMADRLENYLQQPDNLKPFSLAVWPDGEFDENCEKLFQWFVDRAKECEGIEINSLCFTGAKFSVTNSVFEYIDSSPVLEPIMINIKKSRVEFDSKQGVITSGKLGIELLPFLALNPQALRVLNGKGIGGILASGLRFFGHLVPKICYKKRIVISFVLEN